MTDRPNPTAEHKEQEPTIHITPTINEPSGLETVFVTGDIEKPVTILNAEPPVSPTIFEFQASNNYAHSILDSPQPSTSHQDVFSPELARPFPKASPRKTLNRGRKKRKSTIYTDTPEKEDITKETEEKDRKKQAKRVKKQLGGKNKEKSKNNKRQNKESSTDDEPEEYFCLVCVESYSHSRSGEDWVQCYGCRLWAHEACTAADAIYLRHNCESD